MNNASRRAAALPAQLLIASNNPGKLAEFDGLLRPLGIRTLPQGELAIPEAPEPHATFIENALAKARHAARLSGMPALADDSGLCVDALDGAPGVHSARFAGLPSDDRRNTAHLLELLRGHADRRAHFLCTLVLVRHAADPDPWLAQGRWEGSIAQAPSGILGFGYDPVFRVAGMDCTAAELEPAHKNRISHRGQACAQLIAQLQRAAGASAPAG